MDVKTAIERIETMRDDIEANRLTVYVSCVEARLVDPDAPPGQLLGWDAASELPIEKLRELFEADDYGPAWEVMDREKTEWYEQDSGALEALDGVLSLLREDNSDVGS